MNLYLVNAENIYFPQIKGYFREIISSYDNGNYRSAMVMLYSTVVCDLLLKLKELSDVYADEKAERMLKEIEEQRQNANNSKWEWELIKKVWKETELLSDESYAMMEHIYSWRNFSAHPAMNEEYELISPTPEITVAYIKKSLDDILVKPSVFAQNVVDRMSDDIAKKREIYKGDFEAFEVFLNKVYLQRMSEKMIRQVFRAFWKFVFLKTEGEVFKENRYINRKTLEAILEKYCASICLYIKENKNYFSIAQDPTCLRQACILLAYYPQIYSCLDQPTKHQIISFHDKKADLVKWFVIGDLEQHVATYQNSSDLFPQGLLQIFRRICEMQGANHLFSRLLIKHYARSSSYVSARNRFDNVIEPYMDLFSTVDFIELIDAINSNQQIYEYGWQKERNDRILEKAGNLFPESFDLSKYENFDYTKPEERTLETVEGDGQIDNDVDSLEVE